MRKVAAFLKRLCQPDQRWHRALDQNNSALPARYFAGSRRDTAVRSPTVGMRSTKYTYRQERFVFTVTSLVRSSTATTLHSRPPTAHAIQLHGYGETLSIKGDNGRESCALLEAHVMDEILHRIRRVDGFEVKSVNS